MFYDLPKEIITKIYEYDSTYKEIYDKIINLISDFPKFDYTEKEDLHHYFIIYKIPGINDIIDKFYCRTNNYKRSFRIAMKAHFKQL